jgi:hypothetical protein
MKEIPLPPDGEYRVGIVAARKHATIFVKKKRGPTDSLLKELRSRLNLPKGFHLVKSRGKWGLYGAVHIKDAKSGRIIRTLYRDDIERILGRTART